MDPEDIHAKIHAYLEKWCEPGHRYRSWDHCYRFFRARARAEILQDLDPAALQLGFYLASWGMYRPRGFLFQHDFSVHVEAVQSLLSPEFAALWQHELGLNPNDGEYARSLLRAADAIRNSYEPFGHATDTLVSKILLGTLGCMPACDRFFVLGLRSCDVPFTGFDLEFISHMVAFCTQFAATLQDEQANALHLTGAEYPLMKLVDMYFWQSGFDAAGQPSEGEE